MKRDREMFSTYQTTLYTIRNIQKHRYAVLDIIYTCRDHKKSKKITTQVLIRAPNTTMKKTRYMNKPDGKKILSAFSIRFANLVSNRCIRLEEKNCGKLVHVNIPFLKLIFFAELFRFSLHRP